MYYVVRTEYVGLNADDARHEDSTTIEIRTTPALGNMDRQPVYYGWAGTTSDWAVHAYGVYATLDAARAALLQEFGPARLDECEHADPSVVEVHRPGELAPMSAESSAEFARAGGDWPITARTEDQALDYIDDAEGEAAAEGMQLADTAAARWALKRLRAMKAELENDALEALGALAATLLGEEE